MFYVGAIKESMGTFSESVARQDISTTLSRARHTWRKPVGSL